VLRAAAVLFLFIIRWGMSVPGRVLTKIATATG
jgi:hypothetical protein